jgi:GntR family transcriptional regulator
MSSSGEKRHEQIAADLRKRITGGEFPPGVTLPPYEQLQDTYGAARDTIRSAVAALKTEGVVQAVPRVGLIVREVVQRRRIERGNAVERDRLGYIFGGAFEPGQPWDTHELPRGTGPRMARLPAPAAVAEYLGIEAGTEALRRRRVTSPPGEPPFQLADTWIHPEAVTDAPAVAERDTGPGGYLDRLEEAGHGPLSWTEYTRTRMPERDEAKALRIAVSMAVMELTRVGSSARTGRPIEATVCVIPGDRVEIVTELTRARSARWPVRPAERM